MRIASLAAALLGATTIAALADEPSLAVRRAGVGNVSVQQCADRAREAFTAAGFRLAERSESIQIAVYGEYVASSVCVQGQPTNVVINVAGPASPEATRLADAVRDGVTGQPQAQQPQQQPRPVK